MQHVATVQPQLSIQNMLIVKSFKENIIKKSLENTKCFAVEMWLQHIATVQAVVLHNQLSSPSHKIIEFIGNYQAFYNATANKQ